jgi:D-glycero-D-manno-heptose 1,7-bisphosphate phosphatase
VNRAVFPDRDGVLNRALMRNGRACAPTSLGELEILPGVPEALTRLRSAGFRLIVVTNQPDVARGLMSRTALAEIQAFMRRQLPLDEIRTCYHDDADRCACRKPSPGMLYAAAVDHEIVLTRSFMVGDRWRDIGAGQRAGCTTVLVNAVQEEVPMTPDAIALDLPEAVNWILAQAETR